jgi:hypothetical protein
MCDINIFEFLDNEEFLDLQLLLGTFLNTTLMTLVIFQHSRLGKLFFQFHSFALCKCGVLHIN